MENKSSKITTGQPQPKPEATDLPKGVTAAQKPKTDILAKGALGKSDQAAKGSLSERSIGQNVSDVLRALSKFIETMGYKVIYEVAPNSLTPTAKFVATKHLAKQTENAKELEHYLNSLVNLAPFVSKEDIEGPVADVVIQLAQIETAKGSTIKFLDSLEERANKLSGDSKGPIFQLLTAVEVKIRKNKIIIDADVSNKISMVKDVVS